MNTRRYRRFSRVTLFAIIIFSLALLLGMGGKPPAPEKAPAEVEKEAPALTAKTAADISHVNINDSDVLSLKKPVIVTFAEVMTDKPGEEVAPGAMPFTITPEIEGKGWWLTDKSFAFAANKQYVPGRKYSLVFKDSLKTLDGKPVRYFFSFRARAPQLREVTPSVYDEAKATQTLALNFSSMVAHDALIEHLTIKDTQSGETIPLSIAGEGTKASSFTLLAQLGKYRPQLTLTIAPDAESDKHPLGFTEAQSTTIALPKPGEGGVPTATSGTGTESPLTIRSGYCYENEDGALTVKFPLSQPLAARDQKEFIRITPDIPYTLNSTNSVILLREGVKPGTGITVTLKPGLMDAAGRVLQKELSQTTIVDDLESRAGFAEHGHMLSPMFGSRIGLSLVNVDQISVTLERQYENNLPFMEFKPRDFAQEMMRRLSFKEIQLKDMKKNEVTRRALDIADLAGEHGTPKGVFMLKITGHTKRNEGGEEYLNYAGTEERLVVLTDIGLTARVFQTGLTVFATGISTGKPLPGTKIHVYSSSNQLLAQGTTDENGLFTFRRPTDGGEWEDQLRPAIVTARTTKNGETDDLTFLPLHGETYISLASSGERPYLTKGYEAFVYPPRGVFRPGETVDLKAFVRGAEQSVPTAFPVLFRIESPRGVEAARGSATLSAEGGANFSFTLAQSAATGRYSVSLQLPGQQDATIGYTDFLVEDFTPPKLEVSVTPEESYLSADNALPVTLQSRYLFGASAEGLEYELGYRVVPTAFTPASALYEGFIFGDHERKFSIQSDLDYIKGKLGVEGKSDIPFKAPAGDWTPPALLNVTVIGSVQEDSGRWVTQTGAFTYSPTEHLLGLKVQGEHLVPGSTADIQIAGLSPDGKEPVIGEVKAEVFLVRGNWQTVYKHNRYQYVWNELLVPQESKTLPCKGNRGTFAFTPKQSGTYLVRVKDTHGVTAARRLHAWNDGEQAMDEGSGRMNAVDLVLDKKTYRPGETARLAVKAPYAGTLFLGLEKSGQLSTRVMALESPAAELEIPVTEDMSPNIGITAWVIRPVQEENREWFPHRAHGFTSIAIAREPYTLAVSPTLAQKVRPSEKLSVPFSVTDAEGTPVEGEFSVALVDEGILSLTGYKTPNPTAYFLAPRFSGANSYDIFDALLRPEAKATPLLRPGGDQSTAAGYQGSLSTQQVFLAAFEPTVRTDANGQGEVTFDLPEYSGKGRLMVVGAAKNRFASAEAPVRIAREIEITAAAPRAVAPGDNFDLSIRLFALNEGESPPETAKVTVSAEGPLELSGDTAVTIPLALRARLAHLQHGPQVPPATTAAALAATQVAAQAEGQSTAQRPATPPAAASEQTPPAAQAIAQSAAQPAAQSTEQSAEKLPAEAASGVSAHAVAAPAKAPGPITHNFSVSAKAGNNAGIAAVLVTVSVPGRDDLSFTKRVEVAVRPPYPRTSVSAIELIKAGQTKTLSLPGTWLPGKLSTVFSLDRSPALAVLPALEYLREYPYGCLEQVTSRAWPYLTLDAVQQTLADSGGAAFSEGTSNNNRRVLEQTVARILSMQTPSGGFGMWPGYTSPDPWRSVHATFFLVEAKSRVPVAAPNLDAAFNYLQQLLALPPDSLGSPEFAYSTKAYAAFVLTRAGKAPLGWLQHLTEQQKHLLPSGRIFLAGAKALRAGNTKELAVLEKSSFGLPEKYSGYNKTFESELRNKSLLLFIASELAPDADETAKLCLDVTRLIAASRYYTTQTAGMASLALGTYLEKTGGEGSGFTAEVQPENGAAQQLALTGGKANVMPGFASQLTPAGAVPSVKVTVSGKGHAFCVFNVRGTPMEAPAPSASGLHLERVWKRADGSVIDLTSGPVKITRGERIVAELTLSADRYVEDVALSDLTPGGLEVENPRLNTAASAEAGNRENGGHSGFFLDVREDRLLVFFDSVHKKTTYRYSMRAVSKGTFLIPPLAADGMYAPEINAMTQGGTLIIE